jgi:formate-dependent nitrite reductase membrane component NrfD
MAGIGILSIALGLLGAYLLWTKKIYENKLYLFILPFLIPLPHIAHETGWIAAEVGRQPWIIYKLMKTANAASVVVTAGEIVFSLLMFFLIYLLLAVMFVKLFVKIVQKEQMKNRWRFIVINGAWCIWYSRIRGFRVFLEACGINGQDYRRWIYENFQITLVCSYTKL